jgi:dienelactone hydrolase
MPTPSPLRNERPVSDADQKLVPNSTWVDHIPVLWIEPPKADRPRELVLFLPNFSGSKEQLVPVLEDLARAGFLALSFDPWQHGERGTETREEMVGRVFGAFRRHMWPILGQTTLDALRVIDWAVSTLGAEVIRAGGLSMGGDIAVAVAGLDRRVRRVAAVVATPDWLRPGMHDAFDPGKLIDQMQPDCYAQYFYDQLDPLTHLDRYADGPAIRFFCGQNDSHVPASGALRFRAALERAYPSTSSRVSVELIPGLAHMDVRDRSRWWPGCRGWLTAS